VRTIHAHEINAANRQISIDADDRNPENGNASHFYKLYTTPEADKACEPLGEIQFQDGPIGVVGINGVTNEALLAIVLDRLYGFQSSKYACPENATALSHLSLALEALHSRTKEREARGVEGTHAV
jgi:hypothetical protein